MEYPRSLLRHRVTITPFAADTAEGDTLGTPVPDVPAYVEQRTHLAVDRRLGSETFGQEVASTALVIVPLEYDTQPRGMVRVYAGTPRDRTSQVIDSERFDEGPAHIELHLE